MKQFRNLIILTVVLIIFSITAFAQTGKISGKVTYSDDNTALHDASVQIIQLRQTTVTDTEGNYTFENVPPGRYTVLVHIEGFADTSKVVDVAAGGAYAVDFRMQIASLKEE